MNGDALPLIGRVIEEGADDRLFDGLLLLGPPLVVLIALLGRNGLTVALISGYLLAFVARVVQNFMRSG
ncbi:MAG: hypothetical protein ABEJ60_00930 [Halodesulfurarchaeum sp.]